jgi:UDP-N-acetylglucosamine--N-acetylmuramyl-(pentapeptide) pyrophosphoryl-undecaprenol N-acetylglucosamine transferase
VFRSRTHVGIFVDDAPGPLARVAAIVPHLRSQATVLSAADLRDVPLGEAFRLRLPAPAGGGAAGNASGAPKPPLPVALSLGAEGASELVAWLEQESPDLLLVDGPEDVAIFARLSGVPVAMLRRHGTRTPAQQQIVDRSVVGKLAPFPPELDPDPGPARTVHVGFVSRFAGRVADRAAARAELGVPAETRLVTVVCGQEGLGISGRELLAAAATTPGWRWHVLGRCGSGEPVPPAHVRRFGWVADPWPHLAASDVVVAGASPSAVAEVADAAVPLLAVPRTSEDDEERRFADALGAVGAAVPLGAWPPAERWAATLDAAAHMDPTPLSSRRDPHSARRAAEWLDTWAALPPTERTHEPLVTEELELLLDVEATSPDPSTPRSSAAS